MDENELFSPGLRMSNSSKANSLLPEPRAASGPPMPARSEDCHAGRQNGQWLRMRQRARTRRRSASDALRGDGGLPIVGDKSSDLRRHLLIGRLLPERGMTKRVEAWRRGSFSATTALVLRIMASRIKSRSRSEFAGYAACPRSCTLSEIPSAS